MDGLKGIRYLYVLLQYGEERDVHEFFDIMERQARSVPQKLPRHKLYYENVAWKVAQVMGQGQSFKQSTNEVMADSMLRQ